MRLRRTVAVGVVAALLGAAFASSVAVASIPDSNGSLRGCVSGGPTSDDPNPAGTLRVIDPATDKCPGGDQAVTFNQPQHPTAWSAARKSLTLAAGKPTTVLSETLAGLGSYYDRWGYPAASVSLTAGKQTAQVVLRLLVDGQWTGGPFKQTVRAHDSATFSCGCMIVDLQGSSKHTIAVALTSNVPGVTVGTRTLLTPTGGGF